MTETSVDVAALYAALNQKRESKKMSWRDLANELGVSASTFSRMTQGGRPDIDTFAALLRWLNMSAAEFIRPTAEPAEPAEPLAMISSHLRARKDVRPEDVRAFEDIMMAAYRRLIQKNE
jgi:transcriptional regulator with XRE-family HTH domain